MARLLTELVHSLVQDPWRQGQPFTPEVQAANESLFSAPDDASREAVLSAWLQRHQPCLFGRIAAQRGQLSYCFLTTGDLEAGDEAVLAKIQEARRDWLAKGLDGRRSGFVISLLSPTITTALPNIDVGRLAQRLCSLYLLLDQVELDTIYTDRLRLELPGPAHATWEWDVGVNYFSAHGDGRWWHDHRIPGGIALSMNSVGHMVKATVVAQNMLELEGQLGIAAGDWVDARVDSVEKALKLALMTIHRAADTQSGKATFLLPHPGPGALPACPVPLPPEIADRNYCEYRGYCHTDETLPSVYFSAEVARPEAIEPRALDFSYLLRSLSDPIDRLRLADGIRVREPRLSATSEAAQRKDGKSRGRPVNFNK